VLFCDGHGIAHPRRFGLASHLGVLTGIPTIGCAKSLLHGEVSELGPARGASTCIKSKSGEQLGTALRTRSNANAVYVSPGHLMDIRTATKFALECSPRFRVPEPLRLAHIEAKRTAKAYRKP
jgi:deoxyribonuclease V